jgi:uncharacterized alkaline shock family protein YloU
MAETTASPTTPGSRPPGQPASAGATPGGPPLHSAQGATTIADAVVSKVAGIAAREVPGVHSMGGGASRAVGSLTQRVGLGDQRAQGVAVEVGEREAAVDLTLVIEYGESIPQVSSEVRENVIRRIQGITGLSVTEVNITVNDLYFPGDETEPQEEPPPPPRVS